MGDHNEVISKALFAPPPSPSKDGSRKKSTSNPTTPIPSYSSKRPAPSPLENSDSQLQPQPRRPRTDNSSSMKWEDGKKLDFGEGEGSGSSSHLLDDSIVKNMEHMVNMLRKAEGKKDLMMSDPVLGCLVSAQTMMMACIVDIMISRRAAVVEQHLHNKAPNNAPADGARTRSRTARGLGQPAKP